MDCSAYLHRIGFEGQPSADFATLRCVQRLHLRRIPFENLDVQLGRRVTLDRAHAFAKLVNDHRGGWCFEMNSVFGWALECIGFAVMPMTGAVRRYEGGPDPVGNHLALCADLDKPYLVDVGLGDGPAEPIPLEQGVCRQQRRVLRLEQLGKGWWRLHNAGNPAWISAINRPTGNSCGASATGSSQALNRVSFKMRYACAIPRRGSSLS